MISVVALALLVKPEMFGRGVISTRYDSVAATQAADGTVVCARSLPGTLSTKSVLVSTRRAHGRWESPQVLPFSGLYSDSNPQFSPDGRSLLYVSRRGGKFLCVWSVPRKGTGWGEPVKVATPFADKGHVFSASASSAGNHLVTTLRDGIGVLAYLPKAGGEPLYLDTLNKAGYVLEGCLAPDESFILFSALGGADEILRPGAVYTRGDLYVSFRRGSEWGAPVHLPAPINTGAAETCPSLSGDGQSILFASDRGFLQKPHAGAYTYDELARNLRTDENGLSKIYRIPVSVLKSLP